MRWHEVRMSLVLGMLAVATGTATDATPRPRVKIRQEVIAEVEPHEWTLGARLGAQYAFGVDTFGLTLELVPPTRLVVVTGNFRLYYGAFGQLGIMAAAPDFLDAGVQIEGSYAVNNSGLRVAVGLRGGLELVSPTSLLGDGTEAGLFGGGSLRLDCLLTGDEARLRLQPHPVGAKTPDSSRKRSFRVRSRKDDEGSLEPHAIQAAAIRLSVGLDYTQSYDARIENRLGAQVGLRFDW